MLTTGAWSSKRLGIGHLLEEACNATLLGIGLGRRGRLFQSWLWRRYLVAFDATSHWRLQRILLEKKNFKERVV